MNKATKDKQAIYPVSEQWEEAIMALDRLLVAAWMVGDQPTKEPNPIEVETIARAGRKDPVRRAFLADGLFKVVKCLSTPEMIAEAERAALESS